jgi:hypothetical protein
LRHALTAEQFREAAGAPEDDLRRVMRGPLLVLYPIRGFQVDSAKRETDYQGDLLLPALGLHFPGTKDPDASKNLVRYRLNRVAQREFLPAEADDDDVDDTDADD